MAQFDQFRSFIRRDVPLAMHTQLQLGGPAEFFAEPTTEAELCALLKQSRQENVPVRVLGAGSNVLAPEDGVSGVVLSLSAPVFCDIRTEGHRAVTGAGAKLGRVVTQAVSRGLAGIEGLIGIPGTVGGALFGNAGTNHGDLGQWVESLTVADLDGRVATRPKSELSFGYRSSDLDDVVILSATLALETDDARELSRRMQKLWIVRKSQQPAGAAASAYAFKNPRSGPTAAELIEQAGLKGTKIGGASIGERNANYILAEPDASVDDVRRLLDLVRDEVEKRAEVELESALEVW